MLVCGKGTNIHFSAAFSSWKTANRPMISKRTANSSISLMSNNVEDWLRVFQMDNSNILFRDSSSPGTYWSSCRTLSTDSVLSAFQGCLLAWFWIFIWFPTTKGGNNFMCSVNCYASSSWWFLQEITFLESIVWLRCLATKTLFWRPNMHVLGDILLFYPVYK